MPTLKAAKKDIRRNAKRQLRNRQARGRLSTLKKNLDQAIAEGENETINKAIRAYVSGLDKAVKNCLIHRNKADRFKARCAQIQS
ncbi:MAG: 30S ribosomal protein S20 [Candidatus Moanabacter tarae]|uniref:Small ribosomal subunit protein bS20 n=1 Tax=Candidatus Moanibacter tarae TaxID=2200854 RepID=A0A2Z4AQ54_9BACT|nr:MAG: 30S ribosomal protein S20 [Candidatus Moanabacter tarae]|tara:strand:- start:15218 stop:15472 length:255 start_codon:yes stop_codon:yes gene_type:complete